VILSIGVGPSRASRQGGLKPGARGTSPATSAADDDPDIYAPATPSSRATHHRPTMNLPLGGRQPPGRVIADHIFQPDNARSYRVTSAPPSCASSTCLRRGPLTEKRCARRG
jgi:hypothetical protein